MATPRQVARAGSAAGRGAASGGPGQGSVVISAQRVTRVAPAGATAAHSPVTRVPSRASLATRYPAGSASAPCQTVVRLGPGAAVEVGSRSFQVRRILGEGSFGTVWAAGCSADGKEVAIKEVFGRSDFALQNAKLEAALLRELGDGGRTIPSLVESETTSFGQGFWRARLAMSYIPGEVLLEAMEGRRLPLTPGTEGGRRLGTPCRFARDLLLQLAPALEHVSSRVYHRDAHARNILVEDGGAEDGPRFALIDFGLAVDAEGWRAGGWKTRGVGGDSRYWPVSQWLVFEQDSKGISGDEDLVLEYTALLDIHSLGLTALQVLVESSARCRGAGAGEAGGAATPTVSPRWKEDPVASEMLALEQAWESYWKYACGLWKEIADAYARDGHAEHVKGAFAEAAVHDEIRNHFRALRNGVRRLQKACDSVPADERLHALPSLLEALLLMISCGEKKTVPPTWRTVQAALRGADGADGAERRGGPPETSRASAATPQPLAPPPPSPPLLSEHSCGDAADLPVPPTAPSPQQAATADPDSCPLHDTRPLQAQPLSAPSDPPGDLSEDRLAASTGALGRQPLDAPSLAPSPRRRHSVTGPATATAATSDALGRRSSNSTPGPTSLRRLSAPALARRLAPPASGTLLGALHRRSRLASAPTARGPGTCFVPLVSLAQFTTPDVQAHR
uniref:non-specific serine/threonine protein kinase n=1 Tax=Alexandrium monilatum TaxID=311494 RepID=A0A7S4UUK3_9DINO